MMVADLSVENLIYSFMNNEERRTRLIHQTAEMLAEKFMVARPVLLETGRENGGIQKGRNSRIYL